MTCKICAKIVTNITDDNYIYPFNKSIYQKYCAKK